MQIPECGQGHSGTTVEQLGEGSDVFICRHSTCQGDTFTVKGYAEEQARARAEQTTSRQLVTA